MVVFPSFRLAVSAVITYRASPPVLCDRAYSYLASLERLLRLRVRHFVYCAGIQFRHTQTCRPARFRLNASPYSPPLYHLLSASCPRTLRLLSPYSPPLVSVLSASFPRSLRLLSAYSPPLVCVLSASCLRTLCLFSTFSPAGPKGCSKDDERVLKGCFSLCHPSHNLFFRRKHLYGTILFPKFSAKVILFFDICKFCTPVLPTFYIFLSFLPFRGIDLRSPFVH